MPDHLRNEDEVQRALLALAIGQLGRQGAAVEPETEAHFDRLMTDAVARMSEEGRIDDEGFAAAAENLTQLVATLAERLPIMADGTSGPVEASTVEEVLAGFCPGFWPFC